MPKKEIDVPQVQETLAETPAQKFERERMSRRAALRKIGITSGMAVFALFSVDDLARMVGKAMERRAGDNKIADQIAREFQQAGIARASGPSTTCQHCCNQFCYDQAGAIAAYCYCASHNGTGCASVYHTMMNNASYSYNQCYTQHCPDNGSAVCICETTPPSGCNPPS